MIKSTPVSIDLSKEICELCKALVSKPDLVKVSKINDERSEQKYLVLASEQDIGKLMGRKGIISNSIRTLINVTLHKYKKRASIRFEAVDK